MSVCPFTKYYLLLNEKTTILGVKAPLGLARVIDQVTKILKPKQIVLRVLYGLVWLRAVLYGPLWSFIVRYCPV